MSELVPSVLPLQAGLDLVSPKLVAEPGSLLDVLNYEVSNYSGYKRIDGYEPYDGNITGDISSFYRLTTTASISAYSVGDIVVVENFTEYLGGTSTTNSTDVLGVVVGTAALSGGVNAIYLYYTSTLEFPSIGTIYRLDTSGPSVVDPVLITGTTLVSDAISTNTDYNLLLTLQQNARNLVSRLPGPAVGLQLLDSTLFAVAPVKRLRFVEPLGYTFTFSSSVGDVITADNGATGIVVYALQDTTLDEEYYISFLDLYTGDWAAASYVVELEVDDGINPPAPSNIVSIGVDADNCTVWKASQFSVRYKSGVINSLTLPGWENLNNGWSVDYELGNVVTGYFNKVEINDDNASPTYYYLSNGTTTYRAYITTYSVDSGSLSAGTAVGNLQLSDLTRTAGPATLIGSSFSVYSDSGLLNKVAELTSNIVYQSLVGTTVLNSLNSRYQMITANYYGSASTEYVFGVNGSTRPFYFNDGFFAFIYTTAGARHIVSHLNHLVLGYDAGSVLTSQVGVPYSFSGLLGAGEFAFGSEVRGLASMNGTVLGVFCENSVWSLVGTTIDDFQQQSLVPNLGIIEYTLVDIGQPIFCTQWGISTLEQSDKYGDFSGARLSEAINPWLRPRLVDKESNAPDSSGVLCAYGVRAKNQYRLYLNDGTRITMTMRDQAAPAFTFQKLNRPNSSKLVTPIAVSSAVDSYGRERVHFSTWNSKDGGETYVYEEEIGWGFAGYKIPHYIVTNWYFEQRPAQYVTTAGFRLHGLIKGKATLKTYASGVEDFYDSEFSTTSQPINLARGANYLVYSDYKPSSAHIDLAKRGMGIQFKIETNASTVEPPHILQVMVVYLRNAGKHDTP